MSTSINTHDGVTVFLTSATEADVHADGAVLGIQAVDGDALRDRVVAFVQERAQRLGVPATAALIDDSSHWTLTVEPDGRVTEAPTGLVTESFEPRPTSTAPIPTVAAAPVAPPVPAQPAAQPIVAEPVPAQPIAAQPIAQPIAPASEVAPPPIAAAPATLPAEPKPHRPTVEDLLSSRPRQRPLKATTDRKSVV